MAGILDFLGSGLLPAGYKLEMPEWASNLRGYALGGVPGAVAQSAMPGGYLNDAAKLLGQQFIVPDPNYQPPARDPGFAQGGGGAGWGGAAAMSPAPPMAQAPAPQAMPSWAMTPQTAGQMFNMAPQAQDVLPPNAEPTAGRIPPAIAVPNNPQAAKPSFSSELFGEQKPNTFQDTIQSIAGKLNPVIGAQNDAKTAQRETARGMYEYLRAQNPDMSPNQAASVAVMAARNPKILEEIMKPHANMEAALASQYSGGAAGGGNKAQQYYKYLGDKKAAEVSAEKQASTQTEAAINLPGALSDAKETLRLLEDFRNHPGAKSMFWGNPIGANIPNPKGTQSFAAERLMEQIKARNFGDQVKTMVGMGALSNAEGMKITDAVNRLDRGLPESERQTAINDIIVSMRNGIDKLHQKAGENTPFGFKGNEGWQNLPNGVRIRQKN